MAWQVILSIFELYQRLPVQMVRCHSWCRLASDLGAYDSELISHSVEMAVRGGSVVCYWKDYHEHVDELEARMMLQLNHNQYT